MIKPILFVLGGFAAGVLVGAKVMEQKYLERTDEEVAEVRAWYKSKLAEQKPVGLYEDDIDDPDLEIEDEEPEPLVEQAQEALIKYQGEPTDEATPERPRPSVPAPKKVDYSRSSVVTKNVTKKDIPQLPVIISEGTFFDNDSGYDQITLNYYKIDKVLATYEGDNVFDQVDRTLMVGVALEEITNNPNDSAGVIYVRSDVLKKEYEVHINDASYNEVVLGGSGDG